MIGDSSSDRGGFTHNMATAAQPSSAPASMIALDPLSASRFSKIHPKVTVWISIGTTIIMFRIPMYTPVRSRGTMLATIRYGTPTMLAQQTPKPIMGMNIRYWLVMLASANSDTAASSRQPACTRLPP